MLVAAVWGGVSMCGAAAPAQAPISEPAASGSGAPAHAAKFERFAVAADHALASEAGAEILRAGGNAVDAAVATSFALSVVRPFSCGIGGGGFMVIVRPGMEGGAGAVCINYRETAPAAVGAEYYEQLEDDASTRGGKACGVPGTVAGLLHALEKYGTMERGRVMAPAIRLAREGFAADAAYAGAARGVIDKMEARPEWKRRYAFCWERFVGGGQVEIGDVIRLPEQAAVLESIAAEGAAGFYEGKAARAIVAAAGASGGEMTLEDLRGYRVVECGPLKTEFMGRTLVTMPPPSSGGLAMAEVFGILERKGLGGFAAGQEANAAAYTCLVVESFKHAFADRARFLGDPAFVDVPVARLMSDAYLDQLARRTVIGKTSPGEMYGDISQLPDDGGTSHLCVIDGAGNAVACTETINLAFGSLVSSAELGFCLNNEMDDFTTRAGAANAFGLRQSALNAPAAGKRPLSSMSPTVVIGKDGKVEAVAGASGGPRIITATTQALLNVLARGECAGEAVARARVHHQWKPGVLEIEKGFDERHEGLAVESWMRKMGHRVEAAREGAAVQMIVVREGDIEAACDPRKGGRPAGE